MKGMAATKYHFMLGLLENVSTFMPTTSVLSRTINTVKRGGIRTEKADDECQGEEYERNPTQPPHFSRQFTFNFLKCDFDNALLTPNSRLCLLSRIDTL